MKVEYGPKMRQTVQGIVRTHHYIKEHEDRFRSLLGCEIPKGHTGVPVDRAVFNQLKTEVDKHAMQDLQLPVSIKTAYIKPALEQLQFTEGVYAKFVWNKPSLIRIGGKRRGWGGFYVVRSKKGDLERSEWGPTVQDAIEAGKPFLRATFDLSKKTNEVYVTPAKEATVSGYEKYVDESIKRVEQKLDRLVASIDRSHKSSKDFTDLIWRTINATNSEVI